MMLSAPLIKALIALALVGVVLVSAAIRVVRARTLSSFLQLVGAVCLAVVVYAHLAEALHASGWMHWGEARSAGHYVDLAAAVLGISLLSAGYVVQALGRRRNRPLR